MADWQPIKDAPEPKTSRDRILVAFYHRQVGWVYFTALPDGANTSAPGFAKPTIWCKIEEPADIWKDE